MPGFHSANTSVVSAANTSVNRAPQSRAGVVWFPKDGTGQNTYLVGSLVEGRSDNAHYVTMKSTAEHREEGGKLYPNVPRYMLYHTGS